MKTILDLGCGDSKLKSEDDVVVGLDICNLPGVDVVYDFNKLPLPFDDNTFDKIHADQVMEHVGDLHETMKECYRILKPKGTIEIKVPHYPHFDAFSNAQHKRFFTYYTMDSWESSNKRHNIYANGVNFKYVSRELQFIKPWRWLGAGMIFNKIPRIYETFFSNVFQAGQLRIVMEVVK